MMACFHAGKTSEASEALIFSTKSYIFLARNGDSGSAMKNTYDPQLIYDMFDRFGFKVQRIDQFDCGNFAKIRAELIYETLNAVQLRDIATRLMSLEQSENLDIQVINVDMIHRSIRVNITTREEEMTIRR